MGNRPRCNAPCYSCGERDATHLYCRSCSTGRKLSREGNECCRLGAAGRVACEACGLYGDSKQDLPWVKRR